MDPTAVKESSDQSLALPYQKTGSDSASASEGIHEAICCRVCLEDGSPKELVSPCHCSGTLKWAHPACIQTWINEKGDKRCEICRHPYSGTYRDPPHPPATGPQVPLLAPFRGIMLPTHFLIGSDARAAGLEEVDEGDEGAQTSAAWCLSAVLLFMSMLLLRQAFEPPLGGREVAPGPSPVGNVQPHSVENTLVYSTMPANALSATPVPSLLAKPAPEDDGAPVLVWLVVKLLVILLPFCILLRIVAVVRDVHLRQEQGNAAEQSLAAVLWNMEAGVAESREDAQQDRSTAQNQHARASQFLPFSVAIC
ncbi:g7069 [Coccomyxa elongata]